MAFMQRQLNYCVLSLRWSGFPGYIHKKKVKCEYKAMLQRTPDIGGSSLEMNLYIAAFVFSLHKAEPEKINPEVVNEMVTAVFESPFMIKAHKNKKCTLFTDKVQDKKVKESIASQTSGYELDWKFEYKKGVDELRHLQAGQKRKLLCIRSVSM